MAKPTNTAVIHMLDRITYQISATKQFDSKTLKDQKFALDSFTIEQLELVKIFVQSFD